MLLAKGGRTLVEAAVSTDPFVTSGAATASFVFNAAQHGESARDKTSRSRGPHGGQRGEQIRVAKGNERVQRLQPRRLGLVGGSEPRPNCGGIHPGQAQPRGQQLRAQKERRVPLAGEQFLQDSRELLAVARAELHRWFSVVYRNPDGTDASGIHGTPAHVRARLEELIAMGATHLLLNPIARHVEQVDALAATVKGL